MVPATGAVVARNTKIWIFTSGTRPELYDSNDALVTTTLTRIVTPQVAALEKLTPSGDLDAGTYVVRAWGEIASTFTVIDEVDTTPPEQPELEVSSFGKIGAVDSSIVVKGPSSSDTFLVMMGEPQSWEPVSAYAVGQGTIMGLDFPAGPRRVKVVLVDAAGNASEPVEVTTTVPKERACAVAPVLPLSLLALVLLNRRSLRR